MTIAEMKEKKREYGYSNKELAARTGVPEGTLQKIFSGETKAPRRETLLKLERVLGQPQEVPGAVVYGKGAEKPQMVGETPAAYAAGAAQNAGHTLEEYLALPEEQRVELIDGVFYDMAAPTTLHQLIGGFLYKKLLDHALAHKGPCIPLMSPVDVQLDEDDKTVVQPDVMIVCDRSRFRNGRIFGAPDFLVEVLSPSTRKKDMQLKLYKYANAGVREYWMIDPDKKTIVVYDLEHEELPVIYGFEDKIPVTVWEGACVIDFKEISDFASFLYE